MALGFKPITLCMLGKHSTTDLYPQSIEKNYQHILIVEKNFIVVFHRCTKWSDQIHLPLILFLKPPFKQFLMDF
jgi:hypothetical protein